MWGTRNLDREKDINRQLNGPEKYDELQSVLSNAVMQDDGNTITKTMHALPIPIARSVRPVHKASANRKIHALKALLESGLEADGESAFGAPLRVAAASGYDDIVSVLITHGAEVDLTQEGTRTALCHAASFGHLSTVLLLLNYGADINYSVSSSDVLEAGWTPLHFAAANGNLDIVKQLLSKGAKVFKTTKGESPADLARSRNRGEVVKYFLQHKVSTSYVL